MSNIQLRPTTHKGRNKIQEAGNPDHWTIRTERFDLFGTAGRWLLVEPNGNPDKSRWVHGTADSDFVVTEN